MAGRLIPFPGVTLAAEEEEVPPTVPPQSRKPAPTPPCVVCGSTVDWDSFAECARCKAEMHEVCYYGRVAAMEEWLEYLRWRDDDVAFEASTPGPSRLCRACRAGGA
jgi:hypothetical protein